MNRKERRRQGIAVTPKTLCIQEEELQRNWMALSDELKAETIKQTVDLVTSVMAVSLNAEFQFGASRINRLIARINRDMSCVQSGHLSRDDIKTWCKDNGIKQEG